jgi:hypothetical protein
MSSRPKIHKLPNIRRLAQRLRDDLRNTANGGSGFVLLYAYNGTGKRIAGD